jgi:plastocyanin
MKRIGAIILAVAGLYSFNISAQEHIQIEVSSNRFTPNNVVIQVGDTVTWTNVQGFHNVNGSTNLFPNNPESFRNEVGGPGWTYTFVFTKSGNYNYLCDPHASFMQGAITVESPVGVESASFSDKYSAFPNPIKAGNTLELIGYSTDTKLYKPDGTLIPTEFQYGLLIPNNLAQGIYFIQDGNRRQKIMVTR